MHNFQLVRNQNGSQRSTTFSKLQPTGLHLRSYITQLHRHIKFKNVWENTECITMPSLGDRIYTSNFEPYCRYNGHNIPYRGGIWPIETNVRNRKVICACPNCPGHNQPWDRHSVLIMITSMCGLRNSWEGRCGLHFTKTVAFWITFKFTLLHCDSIVMNELGNPNPNCTEKPSWGYGVYHLWASH